MGFFGKFMELQYKMLEHNNKLSKSHPYQSRPHSWPLMLRGISYWSDNDTKGQIYMTGNIAGWWTGLLCVVIYAGIRIMDMALLKRQISITNQSKFLFFFV
jgi:dolichyl-phosphate-mannose-protein mannosyltransferase